METTGATTLAEFGDTIVSFSFIFVIIAVFFHDRVSRGLTIPSYETRCNSLESTLRGLPRVFFGVCPRVAVHIFFMEVPCNTFGRFCNFFNDA